MTVFSFMLPRNERAWGFLTLVLLRYALFPNFEQKSKEKIMYENKEI